MRPARPKGDRPGASLIRKACGRLLHLGADPHLRQPILDAAASTCKRTGEARLKLEVRGSRGFSHKIIPRIDPHLLGDRLKVKMVKGSQLKVFLD